MKTFLAVYTGTPESSEKKWGNLNESEKERRSQEGMKAWGAWVEKHAKSIKHHGAPLGKTKLVDEKGVSDTRNGMAAWTLVQAESHDEAAQMFLNHPHFTLFPGSGVEIMECLPMPNK